MALTNLGSIVIAKLTTYEKFAVSFEVECYHNDYVNFVQRKTITAQADTTSIPTIFRQKDLLYFDGLSIGTQYAWRARVLISDGGPASGWFNNATLGNGTGWSLETAGDSTPPTATYAPVITTQHHGVQVGLNPSGESSDVHHYEIYATNNLSYTPVATDWTDLESIPGTFDFQFPADQVGIQQKLWARAVDTSGNPQTWQSIGFVTPFEIYQGSGVILPTVKVGNLDRVMGDIAAATSAQWGQNQVENGDFEILAQDLLDTSGLLGWVSNPGPNPSGVTSLWTVSSDNSPRNGSRNLFMGNAYQGKSYTLLANTAYYASISSRRLIPCQPGQKFRLGAFVNITRQYTLSGTIYSAFAYAHVVFSDNSTQDFLIPAIGTTTTGYTEISLEFTVPNDGRIPLGFAVTIAAELVVGASNIVVNDTNPASFGYWTTRWDNITVTRHINIENEAVDGTTIIRSVSRTESVLLDNADFELVSTDGLMPPPGWVSNSAFAGILYPNGDATHMASLQWSIGITNNTIPPYAGNRSLVYFNDTDGYSNVVSTRTWKVLPGEVYSIYGAVNSPTNRAVSSGGTSTIKLYSTLGTPGNGIAWAMTGYVSNRGTTNLIIGTNFPGKTVTVPPGTMQLFSISGVGDGTTVLQMTFATQNVGDAMDLLLTFPWPTINGVLASGFTGDLTNATVWPAFSGATITRTQLFGAAYGSIQLSFFDGNGVYISGGIAGATASSAWQYVSNHVTAPSGAIYALVNLQSGNLRGTVTLFDSIKVTRDFTASTPFNPQGSMVPDQSIVFSFSTTSTSITISWSTQTKLRPDGSILTIPSGSLTFSSLSAITTYYIYAYVRVSDGALLFANPTPPTTSPSTLYAAQSALDGRIPLDVKAITTANTGSTGSGTGGGGDTCPDSGEHCDILGKGATSVFEAMPGEFVLGYSFRDKQDVYRKIISKSTKPCAAWYIVNGYKCSTMEPVWDSNNNVWTNSYLYPGSQFNGDIGILVGLTVESDSNDESNYYLVGKGGQRQLIHNVTMPPC